MSEKRAKSKYYVWSSVIRNRKIYRYNIHCITKGDICRLARRGGIKRLSTNIYEEVRGLLMIHLRKLIQDAIWYSEHRQSYTISVFDVIYALKKSGETLYGYLWLIFLSESCKINTATYLYTFKINIMNKAFNIVPADLFVVYYRHIGWISNPNRWWIYL